MNNYSHGGASGKRLRAGVVGYTGYSGAELVRLLAGHPSVELLLLDHRRADDARSDTHPVSLAAAPPATAHAPWSGGAVREHQLEVVLTATPPEVSLDLVPEILAGGARAIDLSGAFRLPSTEQYQRWYGASHSHPELLAQAVYGLPELHREAIRTACLVANPGCYPTAAIYALWPLLEADWVDRAAGIVCDAKSGATGAGKVPSPKTHFVQVADNFSAYAILQHRHVPEVLNNLNLPEAEFSFTAHLLPIPRGILATHYVRLRQPVTMEQVHQRYRDAYRGASFIRLYPQTGQPQVRLVNGTNYCDLHCTLGADRQRLVVVSCIDNLVKGAAGQAVQNLNVMFGLEETTGLPS